MVRVVADDDSHSFTIGCKGIVVKYSNINHEVCTVELNGLTKPLDTDKGNNSTDNRRAFFDFELELDKNETVRSIIADL